jgi:hypothetical protein
VADIDICNAALAKLGETSILARTDNNTRARAVNEAYDRIRKAELRRHIWSFSLKRDSIAALASTPPWGYATQFNIPSDSLRLVNIGNIWLSPDMSDYKQGPNALYSIEAGKILTSYFSAPLALRYIYDVTDTNLFDACFSEALASRIAHETCYRITQSESYKMQCMKDYQKALMEGAAANAIETPPESIQSDSWILARM